MLKLMRKRIKMTVFTKILDKAKELESKMKESQEKIKNMLYQKRNQIKI